VLLEMERLIEDFHDNSKYDIDLESDLSLSL
jgi:hypothetical protein